MINHNIAAQCNNDAASELVFDLQRFSEGEPPNEPSAGEPPATPPAEPPANEPPETPPAASGGESEIDYGEFVVPEGFEKLDESLMAQFLPIAKESKLPKEAVQKLIDMHGGTIKGILTAQAATREANYTEVMTEVKQELGLKFDASMGKVNAVIGKYGGDSDAFHQAVAELAAHDPAKAKGLVTAFAKLASEASIEAKFIQGDAKPVVNFYPDLPGKK